MESIFYNYKIIKKVHTDPGMKVLRKTEEKVLAMFHPAYWTFDIRNLVFGNGKPSKMHTLSVNNGLPYGKPFMDDRFLYSCFVKRNEERKRIRFSARVALKDIL